MKRIVVLLSLVLGSLSFSFGLGYPQITVEKGYCEGGKVIRRYTMGEEVHGGGGRYENCYEFQIIKTWLSFKRVQSWFSWI